MIITINDKKYKVKEAITEEERRKGLSGVDKLDDNEGMLFYFDPPQEVSMWMSDVKFPLDIIFFNEDQEVTLVHRGRPNDPTQVATEDTAYVLEVNAGSGISAGDSFEFEEQEDGPVMKVLAPDGSEQMPLFGGERIFRRAFTKQLIRLAKQADRVKNDSEEFNRICKRIGKKMFKEIQAQDARPPEYVNSPN